MYKYDERAKTLVQTTGGYSEAGLPIRDTYVIIGGGMEHMRCVLYEPVSPVERSEVGVVIIHSDEDYSTFNIAGELAKRGYRTLAGQVTDQRSTLDAKMLDIKHAVEMLKALPGVKKVVLMGHSGGATLMSAYQGAAEQGVAAYRAENKLYKCTLQEELIPADAVMFLDSNFGNGAMTLFSVDPAVIEEGNGVKLDPELDAFNPQNGFDPEGSHYSDAFIRKFCAAQRERNNAIIRRALDRLALIEQGKGNYLDDEPFAVTGAAQMMMMNKLIPQDARLLSHTKKPFTLLHKDGSSSTEIIRSVRKPHGGHQPTPRLWACENSTVRSYLSNRAVFAGEDYLIGEDGATGVQWDDTYNCTLGNVKNIAVPTLIMGMTGSFEYLASETIYENSASADKTVAFMEGASHNFDARGREDEFGDTQKVVFDYCDQWMSSRLLG